MSKTIDCITAGSCVLDILTHPVNLDEPLITKPVHRINPMQLSCGGLSCNSGITLAKLGCRTNIFTYIGMVRQMLADQQVDTSLLLTHVIEPTSTTVVTIDAAGQRAFIHCQGAAKRLNIATCMDHLDTLAKSRWFLVGYYSLMPDLQDDLPELFAALHNCGVKTAMDAAGDGGSMQPLDQILPHLDVYIPSHTEATHQTGEIEPRKMIDVYRDAGAVGVLGVKLGEEGVLLSERAGHYLHLPACTPPGPVIDTTGAGDSFLAGFIAGSLRDMDMQRAGQLGCAVAACNITAMGGSAGVRNWDQTMALLEQ
jgi:sugar/nucleoside kinase (ribokinase family)